MNRKKTVAVCYAAAAALWLVLGLVGCVRQMAQGSDPLFVAPDQVEARSFPAYSTLDWNTPPYDEENQNWYLSTDSDPQLYWYGQRYVTQVRLLATQYYPPGTVTLYYLKPGQTEFRETQKVYASVTGEGEYTFDLGGRTVAGLRIDPDSRGGVPTLFEGIWLEGKPLYRYFIPEAWQLALLLVLPLAGAGALLMLWECLPAATQEKLKQKK